MIDVSQLEKFARQCEAAATNLKPYAGQFLDDVGEEFLDIVQAEIQRSNNIDTGAMLASFTRGGTNNVYQLDTGALTLTVGTNVYYAKWVNEGHRQQPGRFVPGVWSGSHFRYVPGASTGMVLKASFVRGSNFFDKAQEVLKRMFPEMTERAFEQYFRRYFG